jgi:murein DD-endopeptidase MepM/ murein hydrolase activator NlpD
MVGRARIAVGQIQAGLARAGLARAGLVKVTPVKAALGVVLGLAVVPAVPGSPRVAAIPRSAALTSVIPTSVAPITYPLASAAPVTYPPVGSGAVDGAGQATPSDPGERERPLAGFGWPLAPAPAVSRPFQPPSQPYGPGHRGVDLVGTPGQPVLAAGAGVVVYAGPLADRGVVSIDHADGLRTSYEPVRAVVRPGQLVRRGEPVGSLEAGHLGCRSVACLHWGLRRDGQYLDPLLLVRHNRVRLLPWLTDEQGG